MSRFHPSRRRGAAMIEFGLWLPMMMMLLSGVIDFGWYMSNAQNVMQAARDGARAAAASHEDPTTPGDDVALAADAGASWIYTASKSGCDPIQLTEFTQGGLDALTVDVSCNFQPLVGILNVQSLLPDKISYSFTMFAEVQ